MKKIKEVIVVEGKSDLILLKSFLDVDVITTGGSAINKETLDLIKKANEERGVIVFTDPDYPGMKIRQTISDYIGDCKHAFVDKSKAIKHGKVGIAETSKDDILAALDKVVTFTSDIEKESIGIADLYSLGLIGGVSHETRKKVCDHFSIGYCNGKQLYKRLNMFGITKEMIEEVLYGKGV